MHFHFLLVWELRPGAPKPGEVMIDEIMREEYMGEKLVRNAASSILEASNENTLSLRFLFPPLLFLLCSSLSDS